MEYSTNYIWYVKAVDTESGYMTEKIYNFTTVINEPPNKPNINGPENGKPGMTYDYDFTNCIDPEGHDMTYYVEWGDGEVDEGFVESGGGFTLSHSWSEKGAFTIKAKLIDDYGAESDWGELKVTMQRTKAIQTTIFFNFLKNRPNLFSILRILLQRLG